MFRSTDVFDIEGFTIPVSMIDTRCEAMIAPVGSVIDLFAGGDIVRHDAGFHKDREIYWPFVFSVMRDALFPVRHCRYPPQTGLHNLDKFPSCHGQAARRAIFHGVGNT